MPAHPLSWRSIVLVFVISLGYALGLEQLARPLSPDGVHFHPWSSEDMMQTVPLGELRRHPLPSLANIHIQPPAFDAIRAVLVQLYPTLGDEAALQQVDRGLYVLGAIVLGVMVSVVYAWLGAQAGVAAGVFGALLVLLHPASILFATFLDSTLLSAFLLLCCYYLLWRIRNCLRTPILLFSLAVLGLFFTRSIFQWPAILLLALCLWLVGAPRRSVMAYILIVGITSTVYLGKQYIQFGLFSTSSFSGVNLANSIGAGIGTAKYAAYLDQPGPTTRVKSSMPGVLTSRTKVGGQPNFNHIDYLTLNQQLTARFVRAFHRDSFGDLMRNYQENAEIYFRPSSSYSSGDVIVEHLPWRRLFDLVFSAPVLPILLLLAFSFWGLRAFQTRSAARRLGHAAARLVRRVGLHPGRQGREYALQVLRGAGNDRLPGVPGLRPARPIAQEI